MERGDRGIELLLGGSILFHERCQTIVVLLRLEKVGLGDGKIGLGLLQGYLLARELKIGFTLREIALSLFDCGFGRASVQNVEGIAGANFLTRAEKPFFDVALHAAAHIDGVARVGLGWVFSEDRD